MSDADARWRRIDEIFDQALDLPTGAQAAFVEQSAAGDPEIARAVERLLAAALDVDGLPESPRDLLDQALDDLADGQDVAPGTRVGQYCVAQEIGRGGMSVVYRAARADGAFEQTVAVKLIKRGIDTDEVVERFEQERQILAHLRHRNIAQLIDGGTTANGRPYFVLELVAGQPIDRHCDDGRLTVRERLVLFAKAARAVAYAHRSLVVHRDIKPSNILIQDDGEPKLLDFGIAKVLTLPARHAAMTRTGQRVMTPAYASPEQIRGESLTTASDVYQLGLLLYLLLTGRWPYALADETEDRVVRAICDDDPTRPSTAVSDPRSPVRQTPVPGLSETPTADHTSALRATTPAGLRRTLRGDLDNILLMALRKEPTRRYRSVARLIDDIERYLAGRPVSARSATVGYRTAKWLRRHAVAASSGAAALLLLVAGGVFYTTGLARERDRAEQAAEASREVSDFLTGLFEGAAPTRSRGEQITARELLDRGAAWIDRDLGDQPPLQSLMMTRLGSVYRELAHYEEAVDLLERAVTLRRADPGNDDGLALAEALDALARVRTETAAFETAAELFDEALTLRRRTLGSDHALVAETLSGFGQALSGAGDPTAAGQRLEEALVIQERLFGADDPRLGSTLHLLALVARETPDGDELPPLERAVALLTRGYEPTHPQRVVAEADLAYSLTRNREHERARRIYDRILPILEKLYGGTHPELARRLGDYGTLLRRMGDPAGALVIHQRAAQMIESALGADHPRFAASLGDQGRCHQALGDDAQAAALFAESVRRTEQALGPTHPHLTHLLINWAEALERIDAPRRALPIYTRAIALRDQAFGEDNAWVLVPLVKLGRLHLALDDAAAAQPILRRAQALARQIAPEGLHGVSTAQIALGRCLVILGHIQKASHLLDEMLPLLEDGHAEIRKRLLTALVLLEEARGDRDAAARWRAALDTIKNHR